MVSTLVLPIKLKSMLSDFQNKKVKEYLLKYGLLI